MKNYCKGPYREKINQLTVDTTLAEETAAKFQGYFYFLLEAVLVNDPEFLNEEIQEFREQLKYTLYPLLEKNLDHLSFSEQQIDYLAHLTVENVMIILKNSAKSKKLLAKFTTNET